MTPADDLWEAHRAAGIGTLRVLFGAMGVLIGVAAAFAAWLAPLGRADTVVVSWLFYGTALLSMLGVALAFIVQQRLSRALAGSRSLEEAVDRYVRSTVWSVAAIEVSVWTALIGLALSAELAFLLFLVPFFVVLGLLFPTRARVAPRLPSPRPPLPTNGSSAP